MAILEKAPTGRLFYSAILYGTAALALAWSWLQPNHYPPWPVFENEMLAFTGLGLAVVAKWMRGGKVLSVGSFNRLLYALAVVVLAQFLLGVISWQHCAFGIVYIAGFATAIGLGRNWRAREGQREKYEDVAMLVALLSITASSGVVLVQWLKLESYLPMWVAASGAFRPFGNLGQPNNQGTLLVTGVLLVELLRRRQTLSVTVASMNLGMLLPAIVMTGSRTALLSALLACAYLLCIGSRREGPFTFAWAVTLMLLYTTYPWIASLLGISGEGVRMENIAESPRLHIYRQIVGAIAERPWTGYGWTQTAYAQSVASIHISGGYETTYAHNFILDWIVWFGIPFGLLMIAFVTFVAVRNWRKASTRKRLAHALLLPFLVHSMLEFPFAYAFFLLPFGLLAGYLSTEACTNSVNSSLHKKLEIGLSQVLICLASVLAVLVGVDYMHLAEDYRVIRFENKNMGSLPDGFEMTSPWVLTDMRDGFDVFRYTPRGGESSNHITKIQRLAMQERYPAIHVKLISVYVLNNRFDDANFEFNRFQNLYGPGVVKWGRGLLQDAHCLEGEVKPPNALSFCIDSSGP